jgi:hypothetical protein
MNDFIIRAATVIDAPFLAETIIEAEKSGTDKLSYATIFGLSESEVNKYLIDILEEEIEGCELSISSFTIVESNGKVVAALSAWIEGAEEIPSTLIKGNLLNYTLPVECIERGKSLNKMIRELHVEYLPNTIQIGACYVSEESRGNGLLGTLIKYVITKLKDDNPEINSAWVQVFSCNIPSLKSFDKKGFTIMDSSESNNDEINNYLPSNKKYILKKEL